MAGLFGLFGGKEDSGSYYLNNDEAKTFGDIDYMRSAKTVKRTFAKKKGAEELESVRQISAMGAVEIEENGLPAKSASPKFTPSSFPAAAPKPQVSTSSVPAAAPKPQMSAPIMDVKERRKADTSMDMFRNMARNIKR